MIVYYQLAFVFRQGTDCKLLVPRAGGKKTSECVRFIINRWLMDSVEELGTRCGGTQVSLV